MLQGLQVTHEDECGVLECLCTCVYIHIHTYTYIYIYTYIHTMCIDYGIRRAKRLQLLNRFI